MPRTTIDLDGAVLRELRRQGQRQGKSMGVVASELLAKALAEPETQRTTAFTWLSTNLGPALVDLEDKEAVQAILDDRT